MTSRHSHSQDRTLGRVSELTKGTFDIQSKLGEGTYASVYKVKELKSGHVYALKIQTTQTGDSTADYLREVAVMEHCRHPNIVKATAFSSCAVVMECGAHNLVECFDHDESKKMSYAVDICRGVAFLHSRHVLHRDLKPENILVMDDGRAVVADFGMSVFCVEKGTATAINANVCTLSYKAPETLIDKGRDYTSASDIWSLGVVLWELFTGRLLFRIHEKDVESKDSTASPRSRERDVIVTKMLRRLEDPLRSWPDLPKCRRWARYAPYSLELQTNRRYGRTKYAGLEWLEEISPYRISSLVVAMMNWNPDNRMSGRDMLTWWDEPHIDTPQDAAYDITDAIKSKYRVYYAGLIDSVSTKLGHSLATRLLAITYLDRVLAQRDDKCPSIDLLALASLSIAADIMEDISYSYTSCLPLFDIGLNRQRDIVKTRVYIIDKLAYSLYSVTAAHYVDATRPSTLATDYFASLSVAKQISSIYISGSYQGMTPPEIAKRAWRKIGTTRLLRPDEAIKPSTL